MARAHGVNANQVWAPRRTALWSQRPRRTLTAYISQSGGLSSLGGRLLFLPAQSLGISDLLASRVRRAFLLATAAMQVTALAGLPTLCFVVEVSDTRSFTLS